MASTGTTAFNLDVNDIIEEAFERCGAEVRSGYDFRTARRSLNLMLLEWANRGINMWTIEEGTQVLTAGTATYALPADTVDLIEHVIRTGTGTTQADLNISRISVSTYASIPTKTSTGRPIQIYIHRGTDNPSFKVWPIPDSSQTYTLIYWRLRRMDDVGNGTNTQDIPFRFLPVMVSGLAYYLSMKLPDGPNRMPALKAQYDEAWDLASSEDREKAPLRLIGRVYR
jgi:hypothetical protein